VVTAPPLSVGQYRLADENHMIALGAALAKQVVTPALITLSGELGAGKSVLARAFIQALGFGGAVKSPTYTLVETYQVGALRVAHLDLYRLASAEELLDFGFTDVLDTHDILLVEWPERVIDLLPPIDLAIEISYHPDGRDVTLTNFTQDALKLNALPGALAAS